MISIQSIDKQYGAKVLYPEASISIHQGKRYGLIGHNGAGKSVLLRLIAGEELPDSGKITLSSGATLGYLPQEAEAQESLSPMEVVLEPFSHLLDTSSAFDRLASIEDHSSDEYTKAAEELAHLQNEIDKHDIYSLPSRASSIMAGLGIPQESWKLSIKELSGGFRMRVLLARLLLLNPDFLLMDEPTNHLDMDSLIWLERFLQRFDGGILIVSHDRDFLNRVITDTIEISGGKIDQYSGNLTSYFIWKEQNEESELNRAKNLNEKIEQTERFIERFKSKATKAAQARSRMKLLDKLKDELPEERIQQKTLDFRLPPATSCGSVPIKLAKVSAGYEEKVVLNNIDMTISRGEKVAIIGPNGAGKSTLLKLCAGVLDPMSGEKRIGHNVDMHLFSQHRLDELNAEKTLYNTVSEAMGENRPTEVRGRLGTFLFSGDEVDKTVGVLSGGEKSRLSLLLLLINPGNTILLDEPTNHLDIASIETVSRALQEYDGTILMVSHDEYFVNSIADRIIEVRPNSFRDFPGTLDDYRSYIEAGFIGKGDDDEQKATTSSKGEPSISLKEERMANREKRKKLERQIQKIEREIALLEEETTKKSAILHDPSNAQDHALLMSTQEEISGLEEQNMEQMELWESLAEELEELA